MSTVLFTEKKNNKKITQIGCRKILHFLNPEISLKLIDLRNYHNVVENFPTLLKVSQNDFK